ncbi:DNA primase [Sphingomonas sp. Y38-1Y]|uniref:DNA primase n=1 Tax=Sphingomonas sp. Y38-1Y TaxID=3078265 RepID=UPI0028E91F71|nr:DNA primase [Sphingomonas sp. Y38-1Y]
MGGHRVGEQGPNDDGFDEDGYDESQRAEILEATRDGPSDGTILTDVAPDLGDDDEEDEAIDELALGGDEVGEEDEDVDLDEEDQAEDEAQADFDEDSLESEDGDDDLDDGDRAAIEP